MKAASFRRHASQLQKFLSHLQNVGMIIGTTGLAQTHRYLALNQDISEKIADDLDDLKVGARRSAMRSSVDVTSAVCRPHRPPGAPVAPGV